MPPPPSSAYLTVINETRLALLPARCLLGFQLPMGTTFPGYSGILEGTAIPMHYNCQGLGPHGKTGGWAAVGS